MRSFLPFLLLTLTACTDKSNTDTGSDTGEEFTATIRMTVLDITDTTALLVEGEPVNPDLCEGNSCEYPVHTADGYEYDIGLDMSGFVTVTHTVRVENEDNGELFQVDWTGEGDYGVDFGWWCTNTYNGDSTLIETYIRELEDGTEVIMVDGLPSSAVIITGSDFSGEDDDSTITGNINLENGTVTFEQWYDGELWRAFDYTDCHE